MVVVPRFVGEIKTHKKEKVADNVHCIVVMISLSLQMW